MAQILKDDVKNRIIDSAKEEFLKYGYEDASMRRIALKSKMTVGNLYRYFKNKEDINVFIVKDTYTLIDKIVQKLTNGELSIKDKSNINISVNKLTTLFDELSESLVEIYLNHKIEFNILMMSSKLNNDLKTWFSELIKNMITENYKVEEYKRETDLLSKSYATAIFDGMKELFKNADIKNDRLESLCKIYFRSYIKMLNNDLSDYIGE